jgi:hypothetical protein
MGAIVRPVFQQCMRAWGNRAAAWILTYRQTHNLTLVPLMAARLQTSFEAHQARSQNKAHELPTESRK